MKYYAGIGARETPPEICAKMTKIATILATKGYILRSGGADGADKAFEKGVMNVLKKEIYLPKLKFNGSLSTLLPSPEAFDIAARFHPVWDELDESSKRFHARNAHQVLGKDLKTPSEFVICWTKDGKASGGTGQALRMAEHYKIPIRNLFIPKVVEKFNDLQAWIDVEPIGKEMNF